MFTEKQERLLKRCEKAGYGWGKFAKSVRSSGKCSPKQEDVLCDMYNTLESFSISRPKRYSTSLTDSEIMSFGLYL